MTDLPAELSTELSLELMEISTAISRVTRGDSALLVCFACLGIVHATCQDESEKFKGVVERFKQALEDHPEMVRVCSREDHDRAVSERVAARKTASADRKHEGGCDHG